VTRVAVVVGVLAVMLGLAGIVFLTSPQSTEAGAIVVGTVGELEARGVIYVPEPGLYVVATEDGFLALWDDARHVGDRVLYCSLDETFSSPAHGEKFDRQGRYIAGPASGDLGVYPVEVREDKVVVDVSADPALPERSNVNLVSGEMSRCQGAEDPPGFFDNGEPDP
jgi:Rieske Fe-S protein